MNIKIVAGIGILAAGAGALGLLGGDLGGDVGPGDVDPVAVAAAVEVRVAMLKAACAPEPGHEPRTACAVWVCKEGKCPGYVVKGVVVETYECEVEVPPVCGYLLLDKPTGCTATDQAEVDGKPYPLCLEPADGNYATCAVPEWHAWKARVDAQAAERVRCPGGSQPSPTGSGCLCMADASAEVASDEMVGAADQPTKDRVNLTVCCKGTRAEVLRLPAAEVLPKECRIIGQPVSDFTMGDLPSDYTRLMDAACAPCVGHDRCPACLCAPGGCAEACRVEVSP
jgi:hypothetical protein